MKKIIVTTSWDDGHKLDLKLASLLDKYNLKGTFYVSPKGKRFSLSENELKQVAKFQEVGAHTISHSHLARLDNREAEKEIKVSKEYLENLLGKEIKMFCYPYGEFNNEVKKIVKAAGFLGSRTVKEFCLKPPRDFFEFGVTSQVYPLSSRRRQYFWQILKLRLFPKAFISWPNLAKNLFDYTLKNGGIYHLWGHSWQTEKHGMWFDLEEVLRYISHRENVLYLTNSQTLEAL